jgi:hypothetical protein
MSALIANASRLKPEIRLAQAVSQFVAYHLSSEQKTIFQTYRSQARSCPPIHSDVMRLTAEIDRRTSGNVLEAVQRFAALEDVIIGGSQNIIACGVWSLVRMSLLVSK